MATGKCRAVVDLRFPVAAARPHGAFQKGLGVRILVLTVVALTLVLISPSKAELCRVSVPDGGGVYSAGHGVYIGNSLVLTALHVVRDARGTPSIRFLKTGQSVKAQRILTSTKWDLAGFVIEAPPGAEATPLAGQWPVTGSSLGADDCTTLRSRGRPVRGHTNGRGGELFTVTARSIGGDSGGPIKDGQGRVVSIISCGDGRVTHGPPPDALVDFVTKWERMRPAITGGSDGAVLTAST